MGEQAGDRAHDAAVDEQRHVPDAVQFDVAREQVGMVDAGGRA